MTDEIPFSKTELLARINNGWDALQGYLKTLTDEQMTVPTDAAGWTVKDHVIHMAVWEDGIEALLHSQDRPARMGLDQAAWNSRDYDRMNAIIQQQNQTLPLAEIYRRFDAVHSRLVATVTAMTEDELQYPYAHFQPGMDETRPIWGWIVSNTFEHYAEHTPWIAAIVK